MEPEITEELLLKIRQRVEQVFLAKENYKPDTISMNDDGSFYCSKSWNVSYGGTESVYCDNTHPLWEINAFGE